jgi:hypothetical protein
VLLFNQNHCYLSLDAVQANGRLPVQEGEAIEGTQGHDILFDRLQYIQVHVLYLSDWTQIAGSVLSRVPYLFVLSVFAPWLG